MAAGLAQQLSAAAPPPSDAVTAEDGTADGVKYRLYKPKGASGPLPVGIWTHGGGFMTGDLDSDDAFCRLVSEHAPSIIVNVDYRLTPEFKSPAQLQDTLTVYKWARQNASSIGGDATKFYSIGGSAGASLALQVANKLVADPSKRDGIRGVAAIVPATLHFDHVPEEHKSEYKAYTENEKGVPIIDKESMRIFYEGLGAAPDDADTFVVSSLKKFVSRASRCCAFTRVMHRSVDKGVFRRPRPLLCFSGPLRYGSSRGQVCPRAVLDILFFTSSREYNANQQQALSNNLEHFPPVYFVSCEKDPLRDDAAILEKLLKKAGVPTKHDFYPGLVSHPMNLPTLEGLLAVVAFGRLSEAVHDPRSYLVLAYSC